MTYYKTTCIMRKHVSKYYCFILTFTTVRVDRSRIVNTTKITETQQSATTSRFTSDVIAIVIVMLCPSGQCEAGVCRTNVYHGSS